MMLARPSMDCRRSKLVPIVAPSLIMSGWAVLQKKRGFDTHDGNWVGRILLGEMVCAFPKWSAGSKVERCQDSVGFGWVHQG